MSRCISSRIHELDAIPSALNRSLAASNSEGLSSGVPVSVIARMSASVGLDMAKTPVKEIEFHHDAMQRFERAVKAVAKSPPQHRMAKKKAKNTAKKRLSPKKQG